MRHGAPVFRAFLNIAELWELSGEEQIALLGIRDIATFNDFKIRVLANEIVAIPATVIERIGYVLSIYGSLVTLLSEGRSGPWLRSRNSNPIFGGDSALSHMTTGRINDMRTVAKYLLAEIYSG
jgi:hypothetical protein